MADANDRICNLFESLPVFWGRRMLGEGKQAQFLRISCFKAMVLGRKSKKNTFNNRPD